MFDLVINSGYVTDPSSRIQSCLNIGVMNGKIAAVTNQSLSGKVEIDAKGLVVSPGFIDMHIHEDPYDAEKDEFEFCISDAMLKMGVTTAVGGNCGIGCQNPTEYLDAVDRKDYPINLGMLVPHESLRTVAGNFGRYESVESRHLEPMRDYLQNQLEGGCIGLSMGIEYVPGIQELEALELMKVAANHQKIVTIHQRSDGNQAISSVEEMIQYAIATGAALQISHLSSMCSFGNMEEVLSLIDSYKIKGVNVGFDAYPYYAFCTSVGSAVFDDGFLNKYNLDDSAYQRLKAASGSAAQNGFTKETFTEFRKNNPEELIIAHLLNEAEVDSCITHPASTIVSDGLYHCGHGHPRGSGTFPRLIREFVMNKKLLSLTETLAKITCNPAERLGLSGKGRIYIGADADLTIFDLSKIKEESDYLEPLKSPSGIEYVVIDGKLALKHGEIVRNDLGRSVRKY